MPEPLHVHVAIGSRFENIELVQIVLRDSLAAFGLAEDALQWIDIAVREAVANAIKHGNDQDPDKKVDVDLAVEGGELVIEVRDQGEGFDPGQIQSPLAPENLLKPNGRGIFYMKSFMDEIKYGIQPGGGTVVTLRKRLPALDADSEIGQAPEMGDSEGTQ